MAIVIENFEGDAAGWKSFSDNHKHRYYTQSWEYGEFRKNFAKQNVTRLTIYEDGNLVGVAQIIDWYDRFGKIAYCMHGPLIDWSDPNKSKLYLSHIKDYLKDKGYLLFRSDPTQSVSDLDRAQIYKDLGFTNAVKTIMTSDPWIIDIDGRDDEQLLSWMKEHGMRQKVPNYIRGAQRKGVTVEIVEPSSDKAAQKFKIFNEMITAHSERKGVFFADPEYFLQWWKDMDGYLKLLIATYNGKPVASALIMMYGDEASYLYAASTPEIGNSNAAYLLQWEAIKHARSLGISRYNFWGVLKGKDYNPKRAGYGYSYFKRSFGGYIDELFLPWEFPYNRYKYRLYRIEERIRMWNAKRLGYF